MGAGPIQRQMATYTFPQKVHLLVDFLLGMRLPETYAAMADFGWSAEKLEKGWQHVDRAGRARFSEERITRDRTLVELTAFKKRWFGVVRIVLENRNPELALRLLGNIELSTQASASFLVEPFLRVLDELEGSSDASERAARELLRERGLTLEVTNAGRKLIAQTRATVVTRPSDSFLEAEARAEKELWDFYLEWSGLARRSISNRNLLRLLGLNKTGRSARSSATAPAASGPAVPVIQLANQREHSTAPLRLTAGSASAPEKNEDSERKNNESATADRSVRDRS